MKERILALILEELCIQTRLTLLLEMDKRCLISHDLVENSLLSMYKKNAPTLEIATKLLDKEEN